MEKKIIDIVSLDDLPPALTQEGVDLRLFTGLTPTSATIGSMEKGTRIQLNPTPGCRALLYVISGIVNVNKEPVAERNLVVFEKDNEELILCAQSTARLLFLSVEPTPSEATSPDSPAPPSPPGSSPSPA